MAGDKRQLHRFCLAGSVTRTHTHTYTHTYTHTQVDPQWASYCRLVGKGKAVNVSGVFDSMMRIVRRVCV